MWLAWEIGKLVGDAEDQCVVEGCCEGILHRQGVWGSVVVKALRY